ncbi:paraquat-inducible protein A [Geomonas sp. RF6]|uniref:paraquat-inducible protein A n=1 Tax=Geomonas sp. RF6 TaxID=2897342 RepID=UPI001E4B36A2|nr:paraquat-inducible protein A [Geomonas sp. RF6]UFS70805.1 paraquat-inducible protein A [Geomonas sp. RF6]
MNDTPLFLACPDCDLLQREVDLAPGCVARCSRCGAVLYRNATDSLNRSLALSIASAIAYLIANIYPVLGVVVWGDTNIVTLFDAVISVWDQHRPIMACIVFITAIVVPGLELVFIIYLLLPLRFHHVPEGAPHILCVLQRLKPWGMVEVFMLGVLVSVVKLKDDFSVIPGVALWSFSALTLLFTATAATFSPRDVWACIERENRRERAR